MWDSDKVYRGQSCAALQTDILYWTQVTHWTQCQPGISSPHLIGFPCFSQLPKHVHKTPVSSVVCIVTPWCQWTFVDLCRVSPELKSIHAGFSETGGNASLCWPFSCRKQQNCDLILESDERTWTGNPDISHIFCLQVFIVLITPLMFCKYIVVAFYLIGLGDILI